MELSSTLVGTPLKARTVTVSRRQLMNYAAAVQDDNPVYFDDREESRPIGHPLSAVAITWPLLQGLDRNLETPSFPVDLLSTQVHYSEYLILSRPVRPGDVLTITGAIAAILPHRSGTFLAVRLEAVDARERPVFTEFTGALLRGVTCSDEGRGLEALPSPPDRPQGDGPLWERGVFVDPLEPYVYDGCTDIVFPIHTSPRFAREVGLPGIILQGTATLAYAVRELINQEASRQPWRLKRLSCRFTQMVLPGTEIRVQLLCAVPSGAGRELFFAVLNDQGQEAVSRGYALLENRPS
jgi:acyl dehydratase